MTLERMDPHLRACARALAGDSLPDARRACVPVFTTYSAGLAALD